MKVYRHLQLSDRIVIQKMIDKGYKAKYIADISGFHISTIYRELNRNTIPIFGYFSLFAQQDAQNRRADGSPKPVLNNKELIDYVEKKLKCRWSPDQISNRIKIDYPKDFQMRISHETAYQYIWKNKKSGGDLYKYLRQGNKKRRSRSKGNKNRGQIKDRKMIGERPPGVESKKRFGHWEGDTVEGSAKKGYIATHVERKSKLLVAALLENKSADCLNKGTIKAFRNIPDALIKTMTFDNGKEFSKFREIEKRLSTSVYFANPYSPWERGLNENTNGLLRQYFPKKMNLLSVKSVQLKKAVDEINDRPRKCLNYRTPWEMFTDKIFALQI